MLFGFIPFIIFNILVGDLKYFISFVLIYHWCFLESLEVTVVTHHILYNVFCQKRVIVLLPPPAFFHIYIILSTTKYSHPWGRILYMLYSTEIWLIRLEQVVKNINCCENIECLWLSKLKLNQDTGTHTSNLAKKNVMGILVTRLQFYDYSYNDVRIAIWSSLTWSGIGPLLIQK